MTPPILSRVVSIHETRLEFIGRSKRNNPGAREVVGRQQGILHSLGLKVERS
jgi:hypothetical protein